MLVHEIKKNKKTFDIIKILSNILLALKVISSKLKNKRVKNRVSLWI